MVRPAMLYGMETVPVTKRNEKQMEVAEMKILRFSLGITRLDKVKNSEVKERLKMGELSKKISESRLRWYGHVHRREQQHVTRKVQDLKIGKRRRGRPKRRWKDCVEEDMKTKGIRKEDAKNRKIWKMKIHTSHPS